ELPAQRLRALSASGKERTPAEQRVTSLAPVVVPRVVRRDEPVRERVRVVEVLRLHDARRVLDAARVLIEVVIGEGLREGVHAGVAADAVVVEHAAVAAGAPRYVLPDAVRDDAR